MTSSKHTAWIPPSSRGLRRTSSIMGSCRRQRTSQWVPKRPVKVPPPYRARRRRREAGPTRLLRPNQRSRHRRVTIMADSNYGINQRARKLTVGSQAAGENAIAINFGHLLDQVDTAQFREPEEAARVLAALRSEAATPAPNRGKLCTQLDRLAALVDVASP